MPLCWKQQGSGEKVTHRQIFRNLLERSLAVTQRPSTFFFVRQPHLLWWKDCNWLTWNLACLEAIRVSVEISSDRIQFTHFLVEAAFTAGELTAKSHSTCAGYSYWTSPWSRISICEYFMHFHIFFMHILCACVCVLRCTHTHSVFTVNSLFINSLGYKSWSSLCSVLSTAVPRRSVNKLAGCKRAGCLLVGHRYKTHSCKRKSLEITACFKMEKLLDGACF